MANIKAIDTYKYPVLFPVELMGRLRTYIKGKQKPSRPLGEGKKIRKPMRAMTVSDFILEISEKALAGVKMDADSRKWVDAMFEKNRQERDKQRKLAIARHKKPEEKLKPGPKPGKVSPKFLEAMKKLSEKRRKYGWVRGKNKKNRGKDGK